MTTTSSNARIQCYVILQGLERSLGDNLIRHYNLEDLNFLNKDEKTKALNRIQQDQSDFNISLADVDTEELLLYLDLGDLLSLLNRHLKNSKNIQHEHVKAATKIISEKGILSIRKRIMHPIRPLEVDDLTNLLSVANQLRKIAPSLSWDPLSINLRRQKREGATLDVTIPSYFVEESPVIHNLPPSEFDDTGFIGRTKERTYLKKLLMSDHRVITVVGPAGIGKTALSLRVCNDLLDESKPAFDRIIWVTMKTTQLTSEGIREIHNAIDSVSSLVDNILTFLNLSAISNWEDILEQLKNSKTLLVSCNI